MRNYYLKKCKKNIVLKVDFRLKKYKIIHITVYFIGTKYL